MKYLIAALILFSSVIYAQELNCTVTVNMDNVTPSNRHLLDGFSQAISDYMNKTHFASDSWQGGQITCGLSIFMLSATSDGKFTAQVVVTSQRPVYQSTKNSLMLSINDNMWSFTYQKGQAFISNQSTFDPLTSFLDYYAYLIMGYNEDSWEEYGGTPYFNKALNIDNLALTSSFSNGWAISSGSYSREGLVEDLLNDRYRPYREAFYQYYYGIDYYENRNKVEGAQKIVNALKMIYGLKDKIDFGSVVLRTFFDARSGEIVEYLKNYPDKSIFAMLKRIDPAHTSKYDQAMGVN